jgi:hypothetical protein
MSLLVKNIASYVSESACLFGGSAFRLRAGTFPYCCHANAKTTTRQFTRLFSPE